MSKEEKALALALDTAFARDFDLDQGESDGVKSASTPRLRLEAAQLLADKVGPEPHSPSEANLMDEIFKGGSSSFVKPSALLAILPLLPAVFFLPNLVALSHLLDYYNYCTQNYTSSDVDNKQTLDEMDKILENLKSRRSTRHQDDKDSDDYNYDLRDSDDEDDEEFRAQLQLYRRHQSQDQSQDQELKHEQQSQDQGQHEHEPLTARTANEQTIEALSLLIQRDAKQEAGSDSDDGGTDSKGVAGGGDTSRRENDMLFLRIEQETRVRNDDSLRQAEEKACFDCAELENGMSELEAQLRGFGSELDYLLLSEEDRAAGKK
eukprot:CAMPEP_0114462878 /NCGR_PEP_ID=MMETSP0104-20121206/7061_1 /TAXON_ID=37642 ORGANISM="Paraphysomonas imperforata, Strain PA2" /NCGR_SAMPLE_ID=MMETSP0104 /ASSEMBLY_ACC=CAM_ASM_000202 /LENGTH=320 /DNA_ID=CAMNT_0001635781 /DNA_START=106 /DNA_END=1068 /DNA_ORIENTATION=+